MRVLGALFLVFILLILLGSGGFALIMGLIGGIVGVFAGLLGLVFGLIFGLLPLAVPIIGLFLIIMGIVHLCSCRA